MERKRRCRWIDQAELGPVVVVWGRNGCVVRECPRSVISADSLSWLEEYHIWRMCPTTPLTHLEARKAEAFLIIEAERRKEIGNGE